MKEKKYNTDQSVAQAVHFFPTPTKSERGVTEPGPQSTVLG